MPQKAITLTGSGANARISADPLVAGSGDKGFIHPDPTIALTGGLKQISPDPATADSQKANVKVSY